MKKTKLLKLGVTLKELQKDLSAEDREFIEAEKRYYYMIIALKKQREKLGFTQETLAKKSNLPRTTITKVESGSRNATISTLMSMASAMGKTLELRLT